MRVIGTAGHVDHGKSTLVVALTGINPDRLKEEQEREMTIDLGFAWLTLPNGEEIGIVDVPGHRDFIENMLTGVGGIDAVLLVIAADEGIMPQTREHLAILDLLQIQAGVIVISKIDLIEDSAWLDMVESDIHKVIQKTVLNDSPIVRVSSRTQVGIPELLNCLTRILQKTAIRPDLSRPRLPVDRVFSIAGFGTVVTGTLLDGKFTTGDDVEILPSGLRGRIRGLQTHRKKTKSAVPGTRTAINISGIEVEQIQRGEVVTLPNLYDTSQRLDLNVRLLPDISKALRHHSEVKFFIGTSETLADVRLLGVDTLQGGETGWLQLDLHTPVVAVRGDRYILRRPSPSETIGGGIVVDAKPIARHKRYDKAVLQALDAILHGSPLDVVMQSALTLGPASVKEIITHSQLDNKVAIEALNELCTTGQLIQVDDGSMSTENILFTDSQWKELITSTVSILSTFHETYPLRHGIPREELRSRIILTPRIFNLILPKLAKEGVLTEGAKWVALPNHSVRFSPFQTVKVEKLLALFAASPFAPPSVRECVDGVGEEIFNSLKDFGDLVAVSDTVVFRKIDYEAMVAIIRKAIGLRGQVSLAEVRDLLQTSRKYVQALLEHMDAVGITLRDGDFRKMRP
jgi:selenocysteine-specific elongation factor